MKKHGLFILFYYVFLTGCTLTAHQQFKQAELQRNKWKSLRFTGSMESDKRILQQLILDGKNLSNEYKKVAQHKKEKWVFAAVFRMAEMQELFAKKIEDAPKPKDLSIKDQKEYSLKLQNFSKKFTSAAISSYQQLVKKAEEIRYYDTWVCRAQKRLALFHQNTLHADNLVCFPKQAQFSMQDGHQRFQDDRGILQAEGAFRNKRRHGLWRFWHPNGTQKSHCNYQDGEMHGACRSSYSSGNTRMQAHFLRGQLHGTLILWYETGAKRRQLTFVDGKKQGIATSWYPNGAKHVEINFKDDKFQGIVTYWYPEGQKHEESTFHTGKIEQLTSWHKNGQRKSVRFFQNGKLHGKSTDWYPDGRKEWEADFQNGRLHGKSIEWYPNGNKKKETDFQNGKPSGKASIWHESGHLL